MQSVKGLNARTLELTHGFVVEPPDQGLCAGNGFVIEMVNLNLQVFNSNLRAVSGPMVLETLFNEPLAFGVQGGPVTVQGDPRCYWDANTKRWFLSQLNVDVINNTSRIDLAVSTSSNPLGDYNVYYLDNTDNFNPSCPCFGDQPTMGANHDAIFISTNEFALQRKRLQRRRPLHDRQASARQRRRHGQRGRRLHRARHARAGPSTRILRRD